jgi:hypothetical protein
LLGNVNVQCLEELHCFVFDLNLVLFGYLSWFPIQEGAKLFEINARLTCLLLYLFFLDDDLLLLEHDLKSVELDQGQLFGKRLIYENEMLSMLAKIFYLIL